MDKRCGSNSEKARILVVDDDPVNARMAARIARFGGFEVMECHGAVEAVDLARAWQPDLVLADVVMPVLDGSEMCVLLKSIPETRDIPVLFVSGQAGDEYAPIGRFCGASDFLAKPYTPAKMIRAINRILGHVLDLAPRATLRDAMAD